MPSFLLFRKKARSRRLFAYKCAHNAFGSLPPFCDFRVHLNRSAFPKIGKVRKNLADFTYSSISCIRIFVEEVFEFAEVMCKIIDY